MKKAPVKYTRGPSMKGTIPVPDFLPPGHMIRKRERPKKVMVPLAPYYLEILEKEASRRRKPPEALMGSILEAYAETMH